MNTPNAAPQTADDQPDLSRVHPDVAALLAEQPGLASVASMFMEQDDAHHRRSLQILARARLVVPDAAAKAANPHRVAAFFDLDGTVLRGSIIQHLTAQGFADGHGKLSHLAQFAVCYLLYKLNLIPRVTMYRWGYGPAAGQNLRTVREYVDRCVNERIKGAVYAEAMEAVAAHRAAGHLVVAITGAPDYAAAEVCAYVGLHDLLATPTPIDDDVITANVQEPVCYSDGKLAYLRAYAASHDVDLTRSYFYSDSASDIPVLKAVGRPRVINSQWLLWPYAVLRRWHRTRWTRHQPGGLPVASASRELHASPTVEA